MSNKNIMPFERKDLRSVQRLVAVACEIMGINGHLFNNELSDSDFEHVTWVLKKANILLSNINEQIEKDAENETI